MTDLGPIALSAIVTEGVSRSETESGRPVARFWVQVSRQWAGPVDLSGKSIWCHATGYAANSAAKYIYPGARMLLAGMLRQWIVPREGRSDEEELFIGVEQIAYLSPREVAAAAKTRGRTW